MAVVIFDVSIESTGTINRFLVAWKNQETGKTGSFDETIDMSREESQWLWQMPRHRLIIGKKLFNFLDGKNHFFEQALEQAKLKGDSPIINLTACRETEDWPFEILAKDTTFLLPQGLHLIRTFPHLAEQAVSPEDRPLKLLFMASSPIDAKKELDFEKEEAAFFQVTGDLTLDLEVEDSGSLEGLATLLGKGKYDVVHLSGQAGRDETGSPYLVMENHTGGEHRVSPGELWQKALQKNPPQLLVLAEHAFASQLVKNFNVPTVLAWGRKVDDKQAIFAGKTLYRELSRGFSVVHAVWRTRYELMTHYSDSDKPAWTLLRLYAAGIPSEGMVSKEQHYKPKPRQMAHIYLRKSRVQILKEGFVGRRRQLQRSFHGLTIDPHKVGLLILGTGGLGKSCLAGKICERFSDHTFIIIQGNFNTITLESALKDAFIISQDENGRKILTHPIAMKDKISHLCSTSFKEKNYLFLLDDFEQNLEGFERGEPGELFPEAAELLRVLLHYLPFSSKMSQLIITSRYDFTLLQQEHDLVEKRLEKIWLTVFNKTEQQKKERELKNIITHENQEIARQFLSAGHGNPRLMEWLDVLLGQVDTEEAEQLASAVAGKQEEFTQKHVIRELLKKGGTSLEHFLRWFSIYRIPVEEEGVSLVAKKARLKNWKKLLRKGMALSLAEHNQARQSYQVTPLLRADLLKGLKDPLPCHKAAFTYFKKICEAQEPLDPILTEEWIYHSLGCGQEDVASKQGGRLVNHLHERLAFSESRRVGEWVLGEKKKELITEDDGYLLMELGGTIDEKGDPGKAIGYYQQALSIWKKNYGEMHQNIAAVMNNLGSAWKALDALEKAIDYFQRALDIWKKVYGKEHQMVAAAMNNLGLAYNTLGEYRKAIYWFRQALYIWKKVNVENHPQVATALNNLGGALNELGKFRKAINYYQRALEIKQQMYGTEHPDVAIQLNNLGAAYCKLGDPQKAIDYLEKALAVNEAVFGREHPKVAGDLNNLGVLYYSLDQQRKAIDYFYHAFVIWKKIYGIKNHNVASTLSNLAMALKDFGFLHKAIGYYEKAHDIDEAVFGHEHPKVAIRLNNLGSAWHDLGDHRKAIDCFEQALDISRKIYGDRHPQIATALNNMGVLYVELGEYERAKRYLEKAYTFFNDSFGSNHPHTMTAKDWLDSCIRMKKEGAKIK
jgi:tetratricopeptide (TPR) repeat protein